MLKWLIILFLGTTTIFAYDSWRMINFHSMKTYMYRSEVSKQNFVASFELMTDCYSTAEAFNKINPQATFKMICSDQLK